MNFDTLKISGIHYGGSEKKLGLTNGVNFYMLKFRKNSEFGYKYNHVSEYIGSHIFNLIGLSAHNTILGTYMGEETVLCQDFNKDGYQFVPFNDVGESSIEENKDKYLYSYNDIITMLSINKKLTNVKETISLFFKMYIIDALIGNFDRHGNNWGFLKKDNKYIPAPIFDNGSCLFPNLISDADIQNILSSKEEINERIYTFPTSQIKLNGKKSSYYEVISSLEFKECNKALKEIYPLINLQKINKIIDNTLFINDLRKQFYKIMIKERYEKIIKFSYNKLMGKENG